LSAGRAGNKSGRAMIYLDHNATTPLRLEVLDAMLPYLENRFGNASSYYRLGREAREALERSRRTVARLIGAQPAEIIFTSGGTEADNLAIRGVARSLSKKGNHIITSAIEHHAVLRTGEDLQQDGFTITRVPVDSHGRVDPDDIKRRITKKTILISLMQVNNETGVIQPVAEAGKVAREAGVVFHTDAVQAAGKLPVNVEALGVDLLSVSAHKLYGPKGTGALYVRRGTPLEPVLTGGHHEHNLRAGTENSAAIAGFARAFALAAEEREQTVSRIAALRDRLEAQVLSRIAAVRINGHGAPRVCNTSNMSFGLIDGESILLHLDLRGICASTGSACTTGAPEPSHVLTAMDVPADSAQGSVRFSLGRDNTEQEIDTVVDALADITSRLRSISSLKAV
jgi:cysteine desulfurase